MGKPTGFMEFEREAVPYRDPLERLNDYDEINSTPEEGHLQTQGARCMDCGVPFCQSGNGCPIDNLCLLYTSPSPRDATLSRMPSSA